MMIMMINRPLKGGSFRCKRLNPTLDLPLCVPARSGEAGNVRESR